MTRHKHASVIHAYAEGAEIQIQAPGGGEWRDDPIPLFLPEINHRIKPRTVKREGWAVIYKCCGCDANMEEHIYASEDDAKEDYPNATSVIKIEWEEEA